MKSQNFLRGALPWLAFAALLAALPFLFRSSTSLTLLSAIGVYAVFALSYNMLLGQGGMLSFGHGVYFGLGGFAAIHLMIAVKTHALPIPVFFAPLAGFAAGLAAGAVLGIPNCKRAGTAFSMISLGLGELAAAAGFMFTGLFGGEEGLAGDRSAGPAFAGLPLGPLNNLYVFVAVWLFLAALAIYAFSRTPLGRLANAVRDNSERAAFIGFDPRRVRYLVFVAASGFAGLAGALAAVNFELMAPTSLGAEPSTLVLLATFIGGTANFYGPILGAAVLTLMRSLLSDYTSGWQLYVGLMFMVFVLFAPGGIAGVIEAARAALARDAAARLAAQWAVRGLGATAASLGAVFIIEGILRWREGGRMLAVFGQSLPLAVAGAIGAALILAGVLSMRRVGRASEASA